MTVPTTAKTTGATGSSDPFGTKALGQHYKQLGQMQSDQGIGQAVGMGVKAIGDTTTAIIGHCMKMSALKHQENMQNKAWAASVEAIQNENNLIDDVKSIHTSKMERGTTFVKSKKDLDIAEARYLEAQKTDKAMKKANKTLVKKVLSDRRSKFYGKTT